MAELLLIHCVIGSYMCAEIKQVFNSFLQRNDSFSL